MGGFSAPTIHNDGIRCSSEALEAFFMPSSSSPSFHGSRSMVNFENVGRGSAPERPFFQSHEQDENADEDFDDCSRQPEKKRRLTVEQVQSLEKNFEVENKLEPERKVQLAKDLGLQPRQVAIWFQNRRARWKTKQLEKDYDALKASYDDLKINYENLVKDKEKLKTEVLALTNQMLLSEKEKGNLELPNPKEQSEAQPLSSSNLVSAEEKPNNLPTAVCKQEDISSAKAMYLILIIVHITLMECIHLCWSPPTLLTPSNRINQISHRMKRITSARAWCPQCTAFPSSKTVPTSISLQALVTTDSQERISPFGSGLTR
ncbi:hypothetical protein Sjap_015833 [Stephania japonica]|uniref:Homeobox-leucine zipper protein n=1 Tax=Stephania japonica TaxID=461633 RepID=A0AAP0IJV1_9MAGN